MLLLLSYEAYRKGLSCSWIALAFQSVAMLHQAHIIAILASFIYYKKSEMKNNYLVDFNNTETKSDWQMNSLLISYKAYHQK